MKRWLRSWLNVKYDTKSDLQVFLEHQAQSETRYHQRISELIATLDKIVTAKYDRPVIADAQPNVIAAPLPAHALSDVLAYEDDAAFIAKSEELLS
jgi:hypothetical protein